MPQLQILSGKRQGDVVELKSGDEVDIGNRKSAKLSIRDPWVSYNHARILTESGRFVIEDQESSNGTWLDAPSGPKKIKRHELTPNDVFALGKTRIRFVADVPAPGTTSFAGSPGLTRKLGDPPQAWWDKGVEVGPSKAEAAEGRAAKGEGTLEQQLREERKMREALERFLELPPGAMPGAGSREEVERQVQERVEKVRRELMTKQVELEGRAGAAEGKLVDLERKLVEKGEQSKKELARAREKAQADVDELKQSLEEARKSARELSSGGDAALKSATERAGKLEQEREEWRGKARQAEEKAERLERELAEAKSAPGANPELEAKLAKALAEAESHKREHQAVIQEIDEISMEQIEIEDGLKARIRELEARLRELGGEVVAPAKEARPPGKTPAPSISRPVIAPPSAPVAPALAPSPAPTITPSASPTAAAEGAGSSWRTDGSLNRPPEPEIDHAPGVERFADESLGVLPRSELGAPSLVDDGDAEGSADNLLDEP